MDEKTADNEKQKELIEQLTAECEKLKQVRWSLGVVLVQWSSFKMDTIGKMKLVLYEKVPLFKVFKILF